MDPGTDNAAALDAEGAAAPADAAPAPAEEAAAPAPAAAPAEEKVEATHATVGVEPHAVEKEPFVSLYNSVWTTFAAVALGVLIVGGIQVSVARIFARERNPHRALTQFVTAMVAIMVGVYVSDMLIAGPHVELLGEGERASILGFVKDTALMIFAYYFGTQSASSKESE
jgi:hypothetical protein